MQNVYTIKGYRGNNVRYIQLGDSGRPVIQTKTGYRADRVIIFKDKDQANEFLVNFIYDRNRMDIKWEVEEYRASKMSDTLVGVIENTSNYSSKEPGEVRVDWSGKIQVNFYMRRKALLNNKVCWFYARTNRVKEYNI